MKKILLFLSFLLMSIGSAFGETVVTNKVYTFGLNNTPSGWTVNSSNTHVANYLKFSPNDYLQMSTASVFTSGEILSSDNMKVEVSCGTFGTWSGAKSVVCTVELRKSDGTVLSSANATFSSLNNSEGTYRTEINVTKPVDPSLISYLRITFSNFQSTSSGCLRVKNVRLTYKTDEAIPSTYTVKLYNYGLLEDVLNQETSGESIILPNKTPYDACELNGWEFIGWSNNPNIHTNLLSGSFKPTKDTTLYAIYKILSAGSTENIIDTLTYDKIGLGYVGSTETYTEFADIHCSSNAVYSGQINRFRSNQPDSSFLQIRSTNSNSGIISNVSGGSLKNIRVVWHYSTNNGRIIQVYTSDTAYTKATNLYNLPVYSTYQTITKGTNNEVNINGSPYFGIRSSSGAIKIDTLFITWEASGYEYSTNPKCFSTDINVAEWFKDSVKFDIGDYDSIHTYKDELNSCDSIRIELTRNDSACIRWFQVPIFGGAHTTDLNNPDCDVVVLKDSILTINSNVSNHDVKVYGGGRLIISENKTYTINSLSLRKVDDTNPYLTLNGNITLSGDSSFYFDMYTDPSEWRWLVLPDTFKIKNIKLSNGKSVVYGDDYLIKTYNGRTRAVNKKNGWLEVGDKKEFMPGEGFIFGIAGDGETKYEYRFKFANTTLNEDKRDKTLKWDSLKAWGCNEAVYGQLAPNHKGWNLIGNPFLDKLTTEIYSPIRIGHLIHSDTDPWDGKWIVDPSETEAKLRYRIIYERGAVGEDGNGYSSQLLDDIELEPFETFFIQLGGNEDDEPAPSILLEHEKRRNNIVKRMIMIYDEDDELFLRVFVNDKKTGMFISNKFTNDYEPGDDLESHQEIYQTIGGYKLLYSAIPDSTLINGVAVYSPAGKLILDPKVQVDKFEYVYAKVGETWYDLLHGDEPDIEAGSFIIYAERKHKDVPTDIDNINTNSYRKYFDRNLNQVVIKYKNYICTPEGKMIKAL